MNVTLQCTCGKFKGQALNLSAINRRFVCMCDDCQTYAHYLGRAPDILNANGGSDIVPVVPAAIKFSEGMDQLRVVRLSPNGMFRFYTDCCHTPVANVPDNPEISYAGTVHLIMNHKADGTTREKALGPVAARMQGKFGIAPLPPGTLQTVSPKVIWWMVRFMLPAFLKRQNKPSPFFTDDGKPVVEPVIIPKPVREQLRKMCGPHPAVPP